jgi:hypothetical protein
MVRPRVLDASLEAVSCCPVDPENVYHSREELPFYRDCDGKVVRTKEAGVKWRRPPAKKARRRNGVPVVYIVNI